MQHTPYHARTRETIYIGPEKPQPVNGIGIAGFIISLAALFFTWGLLSPFGLLVSLGGMFRQPRGLAFAGVLLGLVGTMFWVAVGCVVCSDTRRERVSAESAQTEQNIQEAFGVIEQYRHRNDGSLPDGVDGNKLILEQTDAWDTSLRYEIYDGVISIRSAGPDGEFESRDDIARGRNVPKKATDGFLKSGKMPSDVIVQ